MVEETKTSWIKTKPEELKKTIIDLAKQSKTPSQIGINLRDKYGIPKTKLLGKKISHILKESKIKYKDESELIKNKVEKLKSHIEKNKHDHNAARSLTKQLWAVYHIEREQHNKSFLKEDATTNKKSN